MSPQQPLPHQPAVRGVWRATIDGQRGWFDPSFVLSDDERIANLKALSDAATPGPWIRKWASTEVHYMGGNNALTSMEDLDFAIYACAFVRDMLEEIEETDWRETHPNGLLHVEHEPGPSVEYVTPRENRDRRP